MSEAKKREWYQVLRGLNYPPGRRAEAGDKVCDIPEKSISWLLDRGYIKKTVAPREGK